MPSRGLIIEEAVRDAAARLGLADFVYAPIYAHKGSGVREVGDGLIIAGGHGAVLQVKSRLPIAATSDSVAQAHQWILKEADRAYRQGRGTRRTLAAQDQSQEPLEAYPLRTFNLSPEVQDKFKLPLDMDASTWPIVVVIDHPGSVGLKLPHKPDAFFITLGDWYELNRAIRSIGGLLVYVQRALAELDNLSVPLGHELERFHAFVEADDAVVDSSGHTRPWLTFDALSDPEGADLYRSLVECVWPHNSTLPQVAGAAYRTIVEFLDSVPPGSQAKLGRWVLKKRRELAQTGHRASGAWLTQKKLFVYLCNSGENEPSVDLFVAELAGLCTLRNTELKEQAGEFIPTLGIGVRTDQDGIDYRYFYMGESLQLPDELRRTFEWRFGQLSYRLRGVSTPKYGRNEPCPCGSGRKYNDLSREVTR